MVGPSQSVRHVYDVSTQHPTILSSLCVRVRERELMENLVAEGEQRQPREVHPASQSPQALSKDRGPKTHPKTKQTTRLGNIYRRVRAHFCLLPCDTNPFWVDFAGGLSSYEKIDCETYVLAS